MFHCMAHKAIFANLGAGDHSSASIVVPFSVHTMTKRKPKGAAAGETSAAVCCSRVCFAMFVSRHGEAASS